MEESTLNFIQTQVDTNNIDADITDKNIAIIGCRLANLENFLKERGYAMLCFN